MTQTYVMPEPQVKIVDGEFRFVGDAILVDQQNKSLDYLKAANVYNSEADVYNGGIYFSDDFSAKGIQEQVDEVLSLVDRKALGKDLTENKWAVLRGKDISDKFKDYYNRDFIANTSRITQDLVYQKLSEEIKPVRHLKTQKSAELVLSDDKFKQLNNDYWMYNLEAVLKLDEQKTISYTVKDGKLDIVETETENLNLVKVSSFWSDWDGFEARPNVCAHSPLNRDGYGVAALEEA